MSRILLTIALLAGGAALPWGAHAAEAVAINSGLTIQVPDRDAAATALIAKVEALGGYFNSFSNDTVVLKVPAEKSRDLINFVKLEWKPVQESYRAEDVTSAVGQMQARLKAKQELYTRMEKLLVSAEAGDIIAVETAATKQIAEIEGLKGRLRALQHRMDFSTVTVNFRILQRERPPAEGDSPFEWLNGLGLDNLLREFEQ